MKMICVSDINECTGVDAPCEDTALCLNTYGSYRCLTLQFGGVASGENKFLIHFW